MVAFFLALVVYWKGLGSGDLGNCTHIVLLHLYLLAELVNFAYCMAYLAYIFSSEIPTNYYQFCLSASNLS